MDAMHIGDKISFFRDLEVPRVVPHSIHCLERVHDALAKFSSGVETMLDAVIEHSLNRSGSDNRHIILLSVLKLVETACYVFLLHEGGD